MFEDIANKAVPVAILLGVGFLLYTMLTPSPHAVGDDIAIPTKVTPEFNRGPYAPDATYDIKFLPTGDALRVDLFDDELRLQPGQQIRTNPDGTVTKLWEASGRQYRYFSDPGLDIGVLAAIETGPKYDSKVSTFDIALRIGVVRYADNTLSPDLIVSQQAVGAGLAYFPKPNASNRYLRHIGFELGYVYTPRDNRWRILFGVATEFKF